MALVVSVRHNLLFVLSPPVFAVDMMSIKLFQKTLLLLIIICFPFCKVRAQSDRHIVRNGSLYFSWGYNTEWYTPSNVHVKQESLGNDYTIKSVKAEDHPGWNTGVFNKPLTVPQYNYRLGYFFNKKQDWAFEINFDHTKYIISQGQMAHITGKINGQETDQSIPFTYENGFYYYLNNGANFLLFNMVKRFRFFSANSNNFKLDALAKAGIGPVIPHVENSLFGKDNDPGFQLGGWNAGIETSLKATIMKYAYLEFSQKVDYARYSHLAIYEGRARQAFGTYELILSLGLTIPTGKHNPEFHRKNIISTDDYLAPPENSSQNSEQ